MGQADFVVLFGAVFEETPEIASKVWQDRPFQDVAEPHQKMVAIVENMTAAEQVQLIQAHPELGKRGKMAEASVREQAGAGLSQLDANSYERIEALNRAYLEKFGFPFVMAVKGFNHSDIVAAFESRLADNEVSETVRSISEIYKIAGFRLTDIIS